MRIVATPKGPPPTPPEEAFLRLGAFGELRLWLIDDGTWTWVAAANADHAIAVYLQNTGCTASDMGWNGDAPDVSEVTRANAEKLTFYDDDVDGGGTRSMWEEFLRHSEPTVIASSEW